MRSRAAGRCGETAIDRPQFETLCVHFGENRREQAGAPAPPIYQASLFTHPDCEAFAVREGLGAGGFDYTRTGNPTTQILERKFAALEGGDAARAFGSGMGAVSGAILSCVKTGDHVVCLDTVYGPARTFLETMMRQLGVETTFVRGLAADDYIAATRPNTRLWYCESPTSLVFAVQDVAGIAAAARQRGIATILDNSWSTPFYQQPLAMGIDLVLHSASKYIGGHSDVVAGLVVGSSARIQRLVSEQGKLLGAVLDPFAAWLLVRGLRTLPIRVERHGQSGLAIARWLQAHPRVARVLHPGLPDHPGHALAMKQMRGTGGLFSFVLKKPGREAVAAVIDRLRYFGIGVSWGGFESLAIPIEVHDPGSAEKYWAIRLFIGLEHVDDLRSDLEQALAASA